MAQSSRLTTNLQVEFIPLPPERESAWRAGLLLLLQILEGTINEQVSITRQASGRECAAGLPVSALDVVGEVAASMQAAKLMEMDDAVCVS